MLGSAAEITSMTSPATLLYPHHAMLPKHHSEQQVGQPFVVDVRMGLDLRAAGASDDLQHTVSYAEAFQLVKAVMEGPPVALLEHLAHTIASQLLTSFPAVQHVTVAVSKTHIPALSAAVQAVGGTEMNCLGFIMDNTAANMKALRLLQEAMPTIIAIGCVVHALNLLYKDLSKPDKLKALHQEVMQEEAATLGTPTASVADILGDVKVRLASIGCGSQLACHH
ncbi:7,8-dihydroneopterin aldolase [Haematococcus lacustris]|uniref:7,8-dihydroneopterin aldolase n=1 Tax=Haematococcus lacustris TaxID=44745 RepID=A0A699ZY56_HAELA|nr:7,8-dihydroneopterin aldolase [Haematococcus lacustris]